MLIYTKAETQEAKAHNTKWAEAEYGWIKETIMIIKNTVKTKNKLMVKPKRKDKNEI